MTPVVTETTWVVHPGTEAVVDLAEIYVMGVPSNTKKVDQVEEVGTIKFTAQDDILPAGILGRLLAGGYIITTSDGFPVPTHPREIPRGVVLVLWRRTGKRYPV